MVLTNVVRHSRRSQHWTGKAPIDGILAWDRRYAFRALFEDDTVGIQLVQVIYVARQSLQHFAAARDEIFRKISRESANSNVTDHHSLTGSHLEQIVNLLARLE